MKLRCDDELNLEPVRSFRNEAAMIGIDAMIRSNSTLEDFVRNILIHIGD